MGFDFPFLLVGNHENDPLAVGAYIDDYAACLPDRMQSVISPHGKYPRESSFDYHGVRFIQIGADNNDGADPYDYLPGDAHYVWLRDRIREAKQGALWTVVSMNEVCISVGIMSCSMGSNLLKLLTSEAVDMVLQGHDHSYQRGKQLSCVTVGSTDPGCIVDNGADGLHARGAGSVQG